MKKPQTNFENVAIQERSGDMALKSLKLEYNYKYFYAEHGDKQKSLLCEVLFTVYGEGEEVGCI